VVAFTFRMGGGIAGDVNRTHPADIEPNINDATNPITFYGQAGRYNQSTGTFQSVVAGDTALTAIGGISVRPYPIQQSTASEAFAEADFGGGAVSNVGALDVLKSGYMTVVVNTANGTPVKGNPVYVWIAVASGSHVQGGFEGGNSAGNTIELTTQGQTYFNSQPDANGNIEIAFNL
jgi:hypothetical protein